MPDCREETEALEEVFTIPFLDGYVLYVPRMGMAAGVDSGVADLIHNLKAGRIRFDDSAAHGWRIPLARIAAALAPADPEGAPLPPFLPTQVTLSLTTGCSLRCIYCYAHAGEGTTRHMPIEMAFAAIRMAADNAVATGATVFGISFHGEGEPTYNWSLFTACVLEAERAGRDLSLNVDFTMSTNACWGKAQRDFVGSHFKRISVSLDGLASIQDRQRPTPSGQGSFAVVRESLRALDAAGVKYGLRATVLPEGVADMDQFLNWAAAETRADAIALEPVFENGRAHGMELDRTAFYGAFEQSYRALSGPAAKLGINVGYSGCRPTIATGHFCQATGPNPNFAVMSDGVVSSCYEIRDPDSEKGRFAVYGRYDATTGTFQVDQRRLERIRRFGVWKMPGCAGCFAKWNCGGDCIARCDTSLHGSIDRDRSPRCLLNRGTTLDEIVRRSVAADVLAETDQVPRASNNRE